MTDQPLNLSAAAIRVGRAMLADATARAPQEACGIVLGRRPGERAIEPTAYRPCRNVAAAPHREFELDPEELATLLTGSGAERPIGVFHSHPTTTARPSALDRERAWPELLHWIAGRTRDGDAGAPFELAVYRAPDWTCLGRWAEAKGPAQNRSV